MRVGGGAQNTTNQQARASARLTGRQSAGAAEHARVRGLDGTNREGARAPSWEKMGVRRLVLGGTELPESVSRSASGQAQGGEDVWNEAWKLCSLWSVSAWCAVTLSCCRAAGSQTPLSGLLKGIPEEI